MEPERPTETKRALIWLGLSFLALSLVGLIWFGGKVLLLAFFGTLLAVVLRVPIGALKRRLGLPDRLAYFTAILLVLLVLAGFGFLVGPSVADQASRFSERVPQLIEDTRGYLEERQWGRWLMGQIDGSGAGGGAGGGEQAGGAEGAGAQGQNGEAQDQGEGQDAGQQQAQGQDAGQQQAQGQNQQGQGQGSDGAMGVAGNIASALRRVSITLTDIAFVVVLALFLALDPELYRRGLVRLFPATAQQRAGEVVDELGRTLQAWLVGQLALMLITGTLTGIGLLILGIPLALALAVFVGLMEFIPLVGPILGFIPIVIMALSQGTGALISVAILYLAVQQVEGNILTPLVQQRAVALPPGLTVGAVFLGGALFGPLGVILGTPLMAVLFVLVKMLYVHDVLHQSVEVPGKREPA